MLKGTALALGACFLLSMGTGFASAEAGKRSCQQTAGAKQSANYVRECRMVSPATHPPCNAENSCELILSEVRRGCRMIHASLVRTLEGGPPAASQEPSFCKKYLAGPN